MAESLDGGEDLVGGFGPSVGLRVGIVGLDERTDVGFELANRGVDAALDLLACQLCEPAFYLIDPGRGRRGEDGVIGRRLVDS